MQETTLECSRLLKEDKVDSAVYLMMSTIQDVAEEKKFQELQKFCDEVDLNLLDSNTIVTVLCATHWYGQRLDRKNLFDRSVKHFKEVCKFDDAYTEKLVKPFRQTWKPTFGFERALFSVSE